MGVVWVWNLRIPEVRKTNAAVVEWRRASRGEVDAVISRIRRGRGACVATKETSCPECSYIIRNDFFPAQCVYCGGPL